jgi:hypothetical protein
MTAYTKSTNFATKDTLTSGDPLKIVKGTEINTEFDNIATAVNSKSDTASPTFTGTVTIPILSYAGTTLSAAVTGTGKMVLDTSPTLVTPALGTPASGVLTNCTGVQYNGFKNRIINGAMVIDQRNAGASVSLSGGVFAVDRTQSQFTNSISGTTQRSLVAPTGFTNSLLVSITTGATITSGFLARIYQAIEGFNVADLAWGTASAQTITLSFWVRSSLTGTFAGGIYNAAGNRSYIFTYAISAANTWEYKTITIAGDTSGTWATDNTTGMYVNWDLGTGSTYQSTAGAWGAGTFWATSGSVKLAATSGATFYITGVQLEKGSTATSFDYRPYGTELALCQRYLPCLNGNAGERIGSIANSTTNVYGMFNFQVEPRVPPTGITVNSISNFTLYNNRTATSAGAISAMVFAVAGKLTGMVQITTSSVAANDFCHLYPNSSGQILFTGCEL